MASTVSGSSGQSSTLSTNSSVVTGYGSVTITNGYYGGLTSTARVTINGTNYDQAGPTAMAQGETFGWSYPVTFTHDINGYRGDIGVSVAFYVAGASFHDGSAGAATQGAINHDRKPAATTGVSAAVQADKSIVVTWGGGASPGGSPALSSTYTITYSKDGGAFTGSTTATALTKTFASLVRGANYIFRVSASNGSNDGSGAADDSTSVFLSSGGKAYNGATYVPSVTAKVYNGTAWVNVVTAKVYNGTAWVNLV